MGWLQREIDTVAAEVSTWPLWMLGGAMSDAKWSNEAMDAARFQAKLDAHAAELAELQGVRDALTQAEQTIMLQAAELDELAEAKDNYRDVLEDWEREVQEHARTKQELGRMQRCLELAQEGNIRASKELAATKNALAELDEASLRQGAELAAVKTELGMWKEMPNENA
jgi:chromosome segregation ATPase